MSNSEEVKQDSIEFPLIDYNELLPKLPFDDDGFVTSFDVVDDNKELIQNFFDKYGLVVINTNITQNELDKSIQETFDYIEEMFPKFKRNDTSTYDSIVGLSQRLGMIGNLPVMKEQICKNRVNESIYKGYSWILNDNDIFTNCGRVGYMRATKDININGEIMDKPEWKTLDGNKWLHVDMDPITNHGTPYGFVSKQFYDENMKIYRDWKHKAFDEYTKCRVQGILALKDCNLNDGGFQCVVGFHKIMNTIWMDKMGKNRIKKDTISHRYQFNSEDPILKYVTKCPIKKGSLLVWNSKLPHNNYSNNSNQPRIVQYIKYARHDDCGISYVPFNKQVKGPWGTWIPVTLTLPFDINELNDLGKKIYCLDRISDSNDDNNEQNNGGNNSRKFKCLIL